MKRIVAAVLTLCLLMSTTTFAAEIKTGPSPAVRVNGEIIEFPDQQPYIDESNRTMVPVRFVIEALDAEAEWDGANQAAIITKDGVRVVIVIGEETITVTEAGETRTVTMDTTAVLIEGRTFIPVRFIAEALGCYVDWASYHSTACFYDDVLNPEQITKLQAYEYTQPKVAVSYEDYLAKNGAEKTAKKYGTDRDTFGVFANAREHLYHNDSRFATYYFESTGTTLKGSNPDAFYQMVAKEAAALVGYESERLTVEFLTDTSCIYQADNMDKIGCVVRGIAVVKLNVHPQQLTGAEGAMLVNMGFSQLYSGVPMYIDLDVHMNTMAEYKVDINTIVPLCHAY